LIGWVNSAMEHRLRIRVLVPPGTDIADAQTRELAERLAAQAGDHDAIAVMFYDGLLLDAGGTLGAWHYAPGGVWANAVDAPGKPKAWLLMRAR